jgi:SlyX protein
MDSPSAEGLRMPTSDAKASAAERLGSRIDALETRFAFQDETIETLNATITAQWKQIDALTRQVALLGERLQEAENNAPGATNEPPPHY